MYYEDLSPYHHRLPSILPGVLCVGWIDVFHDYSIGDTPSELIEKIKTLAVCRSRTFEIQVNVVRGLRPCPFCGREIYLVMQSGQKLMLGMSELWFPTAGGWLAAPSLVIHYIENHRYLPPPVFLQAVCSLSTDDHFVAQDVFNRLDRPSTVNWH